MARLSRCLGLLTIFGCSVFLAGCATQPVARVSRLGGRVWDPKLGVWSSPQVVADGDPVPRGGGGYLTGRPYVIGGRTYVPSQNATGYAAIGTASWYGDAFHGRRTANGEVFDKRSISAAHPTLPLPCYVRVTNMKNGRSMIVRVNDRGPYHGGRVMDVSQRVAEALAFRGEGTARVKVEYVGRAPLSGSDDEVLMASLRNDGVPAQLNGMPANPVMVADASDDPQPSPVAPAPQPAALRPTEPETRAEEDVTPTIAPVRTGAVPVPPARPFSLSEPAFPASVQKRSRRRVAEQPTLVLPPVPGRASPLIRRASVPISRRQALLDTGQSGRE
ncbi:septal ring lytic transglycosylase RlpA family protein [Lichenifustis flavocetrariae]|uniref:Endolytic peptidoglycan transglycosylase RlpA n=1 Tax=Lichenifustis flavocetrariae TaxID=2949735 RepID=A0AA42CHT4_9HYPH|nr:septal ring lytic transglycosylase RlpA family protein [Lichenifustis flavocetrariae]MCW6507609.1 septal ring lytic transglycosylase RlpA family protein [Lichenifustis flavocetrariae]